MNIKYIIPSLFLITSAHVFAENLPRHGFIDSPPSRAFLCSGSGGNLNKNYVGIRAYGIAYFKYYFATNEPTHELITAIRALDEKNNGWYYYEQR